MKGSAISLAAAVGLAASVDALHYEKRDNPRVLHIPIERSQASDATLARVRARRSNLYSKRNTISETIDNIDGGLLYFANVTLGTPAQSLRFHVDTGSSDLWANSASSSFCQSPSIQPDGGPNCEGGTYDPSSSSTYKLINSNFQIQYADTTAAVGDYVSDVLTIAGNTIKGQEFGLGLQSNSSEGVMGIGFPLLETAVQTYRDQPYLNVPQQMVAQGLISANAYSLWLDDLKSTTGNLLFGGVDTSRFTGTLTTVPIVPLAGSYVEMVVGLSGVSVDMNGKTTAVDTQAVPVLLDSGSTLMYLPSGVANQIFKAAGATYTSQGYATIPCSAGSNSETIDFNFSGQTVKVPLSELVLEEDGNRRTCLFGVVPTGDDQAPFTLGDTFIRSAYLVYDLHAMTISIAQANFNPSSSNIMEITNSTLPAASPATSTAAVTLTGEGQRFNGGAPGSSDFGNGAARLTFSLGVVAASMFAGVGLILSSL